MTTSSLRDAVETAASRSLIRLFPKFAAGDNPNWGKVVTKARDGAPGCARGRGPSRRADHATPSARRCSPPSARAAPRAPSSKSASERPSSAGRRDAVNGAILTLLAAGNIRAAQDHKDLAGPKELPPNQIGKVTLYKEDEPPTVGQRLAVKGLLTAAGIPYEPGQEGAQIPALLQRLKDLAGRAGGPPPLPEPPDTDHLDALSALGGNQRFRAVADDHDRAPRLISTRWRAADQQREKREAEWHQLAAPAAPRRRPARCRGESSPPVAAIRDGRQLLDEPDPVAPLLHELTDRASRRGHPARRGTRTAPTRRQSPNWKPGTSGHKLDPADRDAIVADAELVAGPPPDVATDAKLLEALDATPLSAWQDRISLVPSRRDQARQRAAREARTRERARHHAPRHDRRRRTTSTPTSTRCGHACSPTSMPARP